MRARRAAFGIGALWTALALTLAGALTARAQSQPPAVQVVHAFQDAWNSGRVERVLPLFADDAVVVDSRESAAHAGRDAVHRWLAAQLGQETHIVSGWGHELVGDVVRWNARLSTFSSRTLRAPPIDALVETVVRDGRIARHTLAVDAASLTRQRGAVRDAFATRTALIEAGGPALGSLPPAPTYPPYEPIQLPNVNDRPFPLQLPWLAVGAASLGCVLLALLKRPPRP
jgi:hypothetical protein